MVTGNIKEGLAILYLSIVQYVWCCNETINLSQDLASASITSPNFGTNQLYPLNINCKWNITAPKNTTIYLVFHSFDVEHNQYCSWDYVSVKDGVCDTSGYSYCGTIKPPTFQANSGSLCLQFKSDVIFAKKGFNATVSISKPDIKDPMSTTPLAPCQSTPYVINSTTFITSPNFQILQNYPNNAHCEWIIVPDQMSVTIQFQAFNVENHPLCGYDSLKIYNGSTTTSSVLSTYCGAEIPEPLIIKSTTLIIFSSDFIVLKSGFKALIKFPEETISDTTMTPLVSTTDASKDSITSTTTKQKTAEVVPDFHTNLIMTLLTSTQKIPSLYTSTKFTTDATTSSSSTANPLTGASTAPSSSKILTSTKAQIVATEAATTLLSTDNSASTIPPLPTSQIPSVPVTYELCSQSVVQVSEEVFVQSPNYGILKRYPLNKNCTLVLNAATDKILTIDFKEMDVENHYSCKWDKVVVYDGNSSSKPVLDTICGQRKPVLISTSNSLTVKFVSDDVVRKKGFKAVVRALVDTSILDVTSTASSASATAPSTKSSILSTSSTTSSSATSMSSSITPTSSSATSTSASATTTRSPATSTSSPATSTSSPTTSTSSSVTSSSSPASSASSSTILTSSPATSKGSSTTSTGSPTTPTSSSATSTSSPATSTSSPVTSTSSPAPPISSSTTSASSSVSSTSSPITSTSSPATSTSSPASSTSSHSTYTSSPTTSTSSSVTSSSSPASSTTSTSSSVTSSSSPASSTSSSATSTSSPASPISSPLSSTNLPASSTSSPTTPTSSSATSTSSPATSTSSSTTSTSSLTTSTSSSTTSTSSSTTLTSSRTTSTSSPASSISSSTTSASSSVSSTNSPATSISSPTTSISSSATSTSSPATSTSSPATSTNSSATSTSSPVTSTGSPTTPTTSTSSPVTSTSSLTTSTSSPATSTSSSATSTSSPTTSTSSPTTLTSSPATLTSSPTTLTSSPTTSTSSPATLTSSPTTLTSSPTTLTSSPTTSTSSPATLTSSPTTSTSISATPSPSSSTTIQSSTSQANPTSSTEKPISICDQTHMFLNHTLSLVSPNYGQGQQYPLNTDCEMSISTYSDQYFSITFQDFEMEFNTSCGWDYLAVYDGDTESGAKLGKFCGVLQNHTIKSNSNQLFLRFHSDNVFPKAGFRAIIKVKALITVAETTQSPIISTTDTVKSSTAPTTATSTTEILTTAVPKVNILASACAGIPMVLTTSTSTIESPGYSESENYPNNMDCQWAIEAPADKIIFLTFVSFDVEQQELCEWDSLSVYDGATSSPDLLIGSYCGYTKPSNITSTGKTLYIKFLTDRMTGKQGFKIDVSFINSTKDSPNNCDFDWLPCGSKGQCIQKEWFCDGEQDCLDNEDESNCDSCKVDEISCHDGFCLPQYQRCDGIPQCSDAEDEDDCTTISTDDRLLVMKSSKWFPVCYDDTWSTDSAHVVCASLGRPGYISAGSQNATEKTYAVASSNPIYTGTSFSKQFSLNSSCPSGQTMTVQCQEKICGIVSESIPQAFIVGGSESAVGEWPWMVAVMSGDKHICGGTIISDQWILTAGHCISSIQHSPQTTSIIAGATNLKAKNVQYRKVSEMILHPQYNFIHSADLGLMRLREPLIFSSTIRPLCLPTRLHTWSPSLPCYIAGWGSTSLEEAARQETVDDLRHAKVKVWPKSKCESAYPNEIKDFMVCAGYEYGHIDACKGDSGGPLMCKVGSDNDWVFVGITSWGRGCGGVNKPGVYTRVDYYREWVQQMIQRTDKSIDCNFETPDICGYMDQSNSTLMWARRSGGLQNPSRPFSDVTLNSQQGSFMYAFIPHEEKGNSATLVSPALDLTGEHCLTFWFNFHGDIDAVFTVYGLLLDNTTVSLVQFSHISLGWKHAEVDLTTDISGILFHVQSFLKYDGGVALDEINISNSSCVGVTKLKCNFDGGTLCNYQQAEDNSHDWQIKVHLLSDNISRSATTQTDHYLEVNGTNRFPGTSVKLLSPVLNSTVPKCLSFKYKISPMDSHTLSVCTVTKFQGNFYSNCYWMRSSSANNTWTVAHAQIPQVYQPFQIGFRAKRGSVSGIVAVDDITRIDGNCS